MQDFFLKPASGSHPNSFFARLFGGVDWILVGALIPLIGVGLITMNTFSGENAFFERQIIWAVVALVTLFGLSFIDFRFLRRTNVIMIAYSIIVGLLLLLFAVAAVTKGAKSWFHIGAIAFEPSDPAKLVLILLLAKYFSRRHVEIADLRHILISGFYAFLLFLLVFMQPDFGQALVLFFIWFGMVLVSGLSKKHLALVFVIGASVFTLLWFYVFQDYQKQRIMTFIEPLSNIHGSGWNVYQSTIAVGSGGAIGKGIGYGTQSKLEFLPEYETDFIFAAFAEEWGFVGVLLFFSLFGVVIWRIVHISLRAASNFETLFGAGLVIMFLTHFAVNVGMNLGLMPVTGITLPFVSYGGSHLLTECVGLGILMGMARYGRSAHRDDMKNEFLGI